MKNNFFENSRSFLAMNSLRNCFLEKIQYFFVRKASKNVKNGPPTPKIFLVIKWVKKRSGKKLASFLPRNGRFEAQKVKFSGVHFRPWQQKLPKFPAISAEKTTFVEKNFFFQKVHRLLEFSIKFSSP